MSKWSSLSSLSSKTLAGSICALLIFGGLLFWAPWRKREEGQTRHPAEDVRAGAEPQAKGQGQDFRFNAKAGFFSEASRAIASMNEKIDRLRELDQQNEMLKLESVNLRLALENQKFDCEARRASTQTRDLASKLEEKTGSQIGRVLAGLDYKAPEHLPPSQLYTLGVSYLQIHEDEKAAVIFTTLAEMQDFDAYRTPKHLLLTGVAWYRIDNPKLALEYFGKVLKAPEAEENLQYQAQARLWIGLVQRKLGKHSESQASLVDLIDHHPHSLEAAWVNATEAKAREAKRDAASEK